MSGKTHDLQAKTTRRGLLAGNIKAIAFIAAGALVTRLTPAQAKGDEGRGGGWGWHEDGNRAKAEAVVNTKAEAEAVVVF